MKNTRHVCQRRAENDKNSAAFATTSKVFALIEEFSKEKSSDSGRESVDQLLRSGELAEQSDVWIRCDGSFNGDSFECRRTKIL